MTAVQHAKKLESVKVGGLQPGLPEGGASAWRGYGARPTTNSGVLFDRQLDKVFIWLDLWNHEVCCAVLEGLLRRSNYRQLQFLWTVIQPALHRDFMYTAKKEYPSAEFAPLSTHITRGIKEKLIRNRQNNYHRLKSAYFQSDDEFSLLSKHKSTFPINLPHVGSSLSLNQLHSINDLPQAARKMYKSSSEVNLPRLTNNNSSMVNTGSLKGSSSQLNLWPREANKPTMCSFIEQPIRRHIQEEGNFQAKDGIGLPSDKLEHTEGVERGQPESELPEEGRILLRWYTDEWNDSKRNEFIHKMLLKLDPRKHYFISSFLTVRRYRDFISLLPEKLSLKILGYLSPKELLEASRASKMWKSLTNNNDLWMAKCQEVKLDVPVTTNPIWKKVFRDNLYLRLNWNKGVCRTMDLRGHSHNVLTVIFDKKRMASGSLDRTIRLWDLKTGHILQTLRGHTKGVWCLKFFTKNLLISGSYDCMIRVWNLKKGSTARVLVGHEGPVWALGLHQNTLVSVSQDRTARVWNIRRCQLMQTLVGHNAAVFAVDLDEEGKLVITGSADRSVRIWSVETGRCKRIFWVSQTTSVMSVSYSHGHFACSFGETICLYKVQGSKLLNTFSEHEKRIESLELRMTDTDTDNPVGMIVSAGQDGMVKYWDISQETTIQTFRGHMETVNCIHFDELRIASASHDHKIRIWDFNI